MIEDCLYFIVPTILRRPLQPRIGLLGAFASPEIREEAVQLFNEILASIPTGHIFPYVRLAIALAQLGDLDAAAAMSEKAVAHYPTDYYGWLVRANLLAQRGDLPAARDALEDARNLVPKLNLQQVIQRTNELYGRHCQTAAMANIWP